MDRIEQLEQFVKEDPNDPFNIYALAIEYQKFDIPKALYLFNQLLTEHSQYVATYYHLGKLYLQNGNLASAAETFEKGIRVSKEVNDHKAHRELQAALRELEDGID